MQIAEWIIALIIICVYIDFQYAQANNCGLEKFQCRSGECIEGKLLCDGTAHCKDSSDETEVECEKAEYNRTRRAAKCKANQFTCSNGQCISNTDLCDGTLNCADGSDEKSAICRSLPCPLTRFRCAYGACIDNDLKCDGKSNCVDESDEDIILCSGIGLGFQVRSIRPIAPGKSDVPDKPVGPINLLVPELDVRRPETEESSNTSNISKPFVQPEYTPRPSVTLEWVTSYLKPDPISTLRPSIETFSVNTNFKPCTAPPQPQNGHYKLHGPQCSYTLYCDIPERTKLQLGSHLIYSCNPGYILNGSSDVSCNFEGKWLNVPVCLEVRCKILNTASTEATCTYNNNWVSCDSPVLPGTRASLSCRNSYEPQANLLTRNEVKCNVYGQWEPQPIQCVPECGILPAPVSPLIWGGVTPKITEFPWHASMYYDEGRKKKYFCGATIIQENLLVTAAHCIYDDTTKRVIDPNKILIATGNIFRDYDSPYNDRRLVKKNKVRDIYIICKYIGLTGNYVWDIAILELAEPFELSTWLVPACLDPFSDQTVLEPGVYGKVAGFGRTSDGESSAILQSLKVPYISYNQCKSASLNADTEQFITIDKFCAGYLNGSSVCDGDSGGGLVVQTNGLWYLRGIVSVSLGTINIAGSPRCDNNLYSLYTRISSHIGWIQDVIATIEQNRQYPECPNKSWRN
nr:PREDICTED: limulus clotting factor C-like [Linepithema humile]